MLQPNAFDGITTGDESWFQYAYLPNSMFAPSGILLQQEPTADRIKKNMLVVFFTSGKLIALEAVPKGTTCTQQYFIWDIIPDLEGEKLRYRHRNSGREFVLHMVSSKCRNAKKITGQPQKKHITRAPHPPHIRQA
jgi:hypothetical protein